MSSSGKLIQSNSIVDASIATVDIAADAVTNRWTQVLSGSTANAPWVTLNSIAISSAYAGGYLILNITAIINNASAGLNYIGYRVDSGGDSQLGILQLVAGAYGTLTVSYPIGVLAAGAHTLDIRWGTGAGTVLTNTGSIAFATEFKK